MDMSDDLKEYMSYYHWSAVYPPERIAANEPFDITGYPISRYEEMVRLGWMEFCGEYISNQDIDGWRSITYRTYRLTEEGKRFFLMYSL